MEVEPCVLKPIINPSVFRVSRQLTNRICGLIFTISFLLWLAAIICVIYVPVRSNSKKFFDFDKLNIIRIVIALGYIFLCAFLTFILFTALRWIPYITRVVLWTVWILALVYVIFALYRTTVWNIYTAIGSILSYTLLIILLNKESFHLSEQVLKEACKMMKAVPSTSVFALFICLLNAFLIGIVATATEKMLLIDQSLLPILLLVANLVFGIWTVVAIAALSLMTVSGTFAEYHWAENKASVSLGTVLHLFAINCRYHIGTAAMFHPLIGGPIALYNQAVQGDVLTTVKGASIRDICFCVYNTFDMVVLRIVTFGTAAKCGIRGEDFQKSIRQAMTLLNNTSRTLTVVKVTESLLELSTFIIMISTAFGTLGYLDHRSKDEIQLFSVLVVVGGMVFIATFSTCLIAACYTIMLLRDVVPQDTYAMSPDLHSALNHEDTADRSKYE